MLKKNIKTSKRDHLVVIVLALAVLAAVALQLGETVRADAKEIAILEIPELGAVIMSGHDGPRIEAVTPADGRLEKYRSVNLQAGDLIVAANGKRITTLSDLREIIESAKVGDEIKLAVQRFGSLAVAKYQVANETERVAAIEAAMTYENTRSDKPATPGGGPQIIKMTGGEGVVPWLDLAVLIKDGDGHVLVMEIIELPFRIVSEVELLSGDQIISIDGKLVSSSEELVDTYEAFAVGDEVVMVITRDGGETVLTFSKPKAPAGMIRINK